MLEVYSPLLLHRTESCRECQGWAKLSYTGLFLFSIPGRSTPSKSFFYLTGTLLLFLLSSLLLWEITVSKTLSHRNTVYCQQTPGELSSQLFNPPTSKVRNFHRICKYLSNFFPKGDFTIAQQERIMEHVSNC